MKALVYRGPNKLVLEERPVPQPAAGELLLQITACGICGSDVHGYLGLTGRRTAPMIMGHEFAARVVQLGEGVQGDFLPGDRVAVQPCIFCGSCDECRSGATNLCDNRRFLGAMDCDGALQQYLCVPANNVYPLPQDMSDEVGALLEAFAVAYSGVKKAGSLENKQVLIVGAGTIGLMALLAVKTHQPQSVIVSDLADHRLATAVRMGADVVLNPSTEDFIPALRRACGGNLAHCSIEAVGVDSTVQQAVAGIRPRGVSVWIGNSKRMVETDMQSVVTRELTIHGSYIYTHQEFGEAIAFIRHHRLDLSQFVSRKLPLDEAPELFERLSSGRETDLKCIVQP